ncbi:MAG: NAD(+) kinase [Pseudomonadota bacterium]|nr:NAD(+) kinase [Pseudomonadota bacterium]
MSARLRRARIDAGAQHISPEKHEGIMSQFGTLGIIGKQDDPAAAQTAALLVAHLRQRGHTVLLDDELCGMAADATAPRRELAERCDLVIVVGGDGTLLNAGRDLAPAGVPLLGVNQGRLGFMVDVNPLQMTETVDSILDGDYVRETRSLLSARILRDEGSAGPFLALNDVVLRNQAAIRMIEFETWHGEEFISLHRADGFIVSTPTGSTAYALSGGGPVLHPGIEAWALVPICPHTLSDRPIVVSTDRPVRLALSGGGTHDATCTMDGQVNATVRPGEIIEISRADCSLQLIHPRGYSYFNILRSKLHWGRERS